VNLITAALLGAVQGVTEFLPVSSTAHLLVAERLIGFQDPNSVFTITIQFARSSSASFAACRPIPKRSGSR
jgi:undecaprenyl pyrophosphate phosphatase UppP